MPAAAALPKRSVVVARPTQALARSLPSAPNYCGEFDNAGAMMSVDETLMCSFQILKPAEKKGRGYVMH